MSSANVPERAPRLAPRELAFLGLSVLVWTGYVVWLGKDTSWDFRNYHWYIPYAFLNGRMDIDVAVAHQASYYNPLVDIPFYWLAIHTTSWFAIAVLGLFQAANIVPIYFMARHSLRHSASNLGSAAIAFFGMTGGLMLSLYGTHYYDNVLSVFTLGSLAILVVKREELAHRAKVEEVIDFLEIEHIRKTPVGRLPYGLQKRVELGRALAAEPNMLLLDEPMAGMNVEEKQDMCRFILDVNDEYGTTIVLIEHDMGVVMDISDRVVVLDYGKKIGDGTPDEVRTNQAVIDAYLGVAH